MKFLGIKDQRVVGVGELKRFAVRYAGERPERIVPVPAETPEIDGIRVRQGDGSRLVLELPGGIRWMSPSIPASAICCGELIVSLDPKWCAKAMRPIPPPKAEEGAAIRDLEGRVAVRGGVLVISDHQARAPDFLYALGLLPEMPDWIGKIASSLVAVRGNSMLLLPPGSPVLGPLGLEAPDLDLDVERIEREIARIWDSLLRARGQDISRLRWLRKARLLLLTARELGVRPIRWASVGSGTLGLVAENVLLAAGVPIRWQLSVMEEAK